MTHPIDTVLQKFNKVKLELAEEAKKALPAFLETEDIETGRTRTGNYELFASKFWLDQFDSDDEFRFESEDDYSCMPLDFAKDPVGHLEAAKKDAAEREAGRKDQKLRLRNERIRSAKETLRLEGFDISKLEG